MGLVSPQQAAQEAAACLLLGAAAGGLRVLAPLKKKQALLPDVALVGVVLILVQGYAAGQSFGGQLRWYMLAAAVVGVLAVQGILGPLAAAVRAVLAWPLVQAARWAAGQRQKRRQRHRERAERAKERRNVKRVLKKQKKNLQNQPKMLYNSNVAVCDAAGHPPGTSALPPSM